MSDLMFEWFEIDPGPSLGGAIAHSVEVPSKRENKHASTIRPQRGNRNFVLLNGHNASIALCLTLCLNGFKLTLTHH